MFKVTQIATFATFIFLPWAEPIHAGDCAASIWGEMPDGRKVGLFTLTNALGTEISVAEYGALLVSAKTQDRHGVSGLVTLSYRNLDEALAGGVLGSVIGRFANRIDTGGFSIDGKRHELESVNARTGVHIHGGTTGFHRRLWQGRDATNNGGAAAAFRLTSPDGHEGYPGTVEVEVAYRLTDENVLRIEYRGTTDQPTHLNLTNHAYFNLAGSGDVLDHSLAMTCEEVLAVDDRKIPTGERVPVPGTPFDFRVAKRVGADIEAVDAGGYDHCFVIDERGAESGLTPFAVLEDPRSGRTMAVATTKPGVQVYTANHFKGQPFPKWGGICFETQFYPDTPNHPDFPSSLLRPGETYEHATEFRFGIAEE
ncbi:MAG: aldose epimerase family protein [Verrucomicrobiales bacterium]